MFDHETVVQVICSLSACLQLASVTMSALITTTIPFYYLTTLGGSSCCSCSPKRIVLVLAIEWVALVPIVGCWYHFKAMNPFYKIELTKVFNSAYCLSTLSVSDVHSVALCITCILFVAAVAYIGLLVKTRQLANRYKASITGLGIRLLVISFVSFTCWVIYWPLALSKNMNFYFDQICLATVAICNPLVFTLLSRPFFKSIKSVWIRVSYECGRPRRLSEICSSEEEERDLLLTRVASQTNYSLTENRTDV